MIGHALTPKQRICRLVNFLHEPPAFRSLPVERDNINAFKVQRDDSRDELLHLGHQIISGALGKRAALDAVNQFVLEAFVDIVDNRERDDLLHAASIKAVERGDSLLADLIASEQLVQSFDCRRTSDGIFKQRAGWGEQVYESGERRRRITSEKVAQPEPPCGFNNAVADVPCEETADVSRRSFAGARSSRGGARTATRLRIGFEYGVV